MGPAQAIKTGFAKSFQFSGRATRPEFWWFFGAWAVLLLCLLFLVGWTVSWFTANLSTVIAWKTLKALVFLLFLLPVSVIARRHRDAGFPTVLAYLVAAAGVGLLSNALLFIPLLLGLRVFFEFDLISWHLATFVAYLALLIMSLLAALWPSSPLPNPLGPNPLEAPK